MAVHLKNTCHVTLSGYPHYVCTMMSSNQKAFTCCTLHLKFNIGDIKKKSRGIPRSTRVDEFSLQIKLDALACYYIIEV